MNKIKKSIAVLAAICVTVCVTCTTAFAKSVNITVDSYLGGAPGVLTCSGQAPAYPAFQYVAGGALGTATYTADMLQVTVNGNSNSAALSRYVYASYGYGSKPSSVKYRAQIWYGSVNTDGTYTAKASQLW